MADFDNDPEALAWARKKIQKRIDHYADFERRAKEKGSDAESTWRKHKNLLRMDFIGGEGCSIAAFDERLPAFNEAFRRSTDGTFVPRDRPVDNETEKP